MLCSSNPFTFFTSIGCLFRFPSSVQDLPLYSFFLRARSRGSGGKFCRGNKIDALNYEIQSEILVPIRAGIRSDSVFFNPFRCSQFGPADGKKPRPLHPPVPQESPTVPHYCCSQVNCCLHRPFAGAILPTPHHTQCLYLTMAFPARTPFK